MVNFTVHSKEFHNITLEQNVNALLRTVFLLINLNELPCTLSRPGLAPLAGLDARHGGREKKGPDRNTAGPGG